jgi:hypothetical protein
MKAIDHLKKLLIEAQKEKYPNLPEHAMSINTFDKMNPEKREKKRIEAFLNLTGNYGSIIENRGQRIDRRKEYTDVLGQKKTIGSVDWIGSGMRKGLADIKAIIKGKPIDIELKRKYAKGKDRQSDHQKQEQSKIELAGGKYWIVESFEDFYRKYFAYVNGIIE